MNTKKVLTITFSAIFILLFAFVLTWGIINFNKLKEGINGTELYTKDDINSAYNDGYNTALLNKKEYEELINSYRDTISLQTEEISKLSSDITILTNSNKGYESQIKILENTISSDKKTIANLNTTINSNQETINDLNSNIAEKVSRINQLEKEIIDLEKSNENKDFEILNKQNEINSIRNEINSLNAIVTELNSVNESNFATISALNSRVETLNARIVELSAEIENNKVNVNDLNAQIEQLQKSVSVYEGYIESLENETQVVVTFEFDNSVYNVQLVNKGSCISVVNPTSTDFIIFNNWTVEGEIVDLSTYVVNESTIFVADVTYKHLVEFKDDENVLNSQIVENGHFVSVPEIPVKEGYQFIGWSLDGVSIIDLSSYSITTDTTFIPVYTDLFNVTFVYDDKIISNQTIKSGYVASNVEVESTDYMVFNGWSVNGIIVDVSTYNIVSNTVFVADITYKYDVKYMINGNIYSSYIIEKGCNVIVPEIPVVEGKIFKGWSLNNSEIVDIDNCVVDNNVTFVGVFEDLVTTVTYHGETTSYASIYDAVEYTQTLSTNDSPNYTATIKLFNNIILDNPLVLDKGYVVLDLNNCIIDGSSLSSLSCIKINSTFVLTDSSIEKSGTIIGSGIAPVVDITKGRFDMHGGVLTRGSDGVRVGQNSSLFQFYDGTITNNSNYGVRLNGSSTMSSLKMFGGVISKNSCGGVYGSSKGSILIEGGEISFNGVEGNLLSSGGIYSTSSYDIKIQSCTIKNNCGKNAGGIYISSSSASLIEVDLFSCIISGNKSTVNGGGVYISGATVDCFNCEITNNTSVNYGGGVYVSGSIKDNESPNFIFEGGIISGNKSKYSSAIYTDGPYVSLINGSITGNVSSVGYGAVSGKYVYSSSSGISVGGSIVVKDNYVGSVESNIYLYNSDSNMNDYISIIIYSHGGTNDYFTGEVGITCEGGTDVTVVSGISNISTGVITSDEGYSLVVNSEYKDYYDLV